MSNILVYIERSEDGITDLSLQCLAQARALAQSGDAKVIAAIIGTGAQSTAGEAIARGADDTCVAEDAKLGNYLPVPYSKALAQIVAQVKPAIVLLPSSPQGNDLAPLVARTAGLACVLDAQSAAGGVFKRSEFDRKVFASYRATAGKSVVVTLKDGIADPLAADASRKGGTTAVSVSLDDKSFLSKLIKRDVVKSTVNLKAAKMIVSAGAGVGSKENFKLVEELAQVLGAEVGASRPVVDAGWASADRQVGQTGVTVKPDLYIACGISGAVQHRVGMMEAKTVVAINTDSAAPIFKFAHYKIVGDLTDVIPKLVRLAK